MSTGLNLNDPAVVAAFEAALRREGLLALAVFAVAALLWYASRGWRRHRATSIAAGERSGKAQARDAERWSEPAGRQVLVIGFGNLWLLDGVLQAQPKMAIGLPSAVIEPAAASSPAWVQHLVNWAGTAWTFHPTQAGAAAVWIQVGLGIWLLAAPRGALSRLAGLASVCWGLVVWVFGEAFGGIFAPGLSWLTGAPGAVVFYVIAGALIALPEGSWRSPRLGRVWLAGIGAFLLAMAALQAWAGRGSWQGLSRGQPGPLAGMSMSMSFTPQPRTLAGWVFAFARFDEAHGFAVNLLVVTVLAGTGIAFLTGRARLIRAALAGFTVVCLAVWVLVQDLGFLGGLGTDPNSMIPLVLLAAAGYLALTRLPEPGVAVIAAPAPRLPAGQAAAGSAHWLASGARPLTALGGAALVLLGAIPMAVAQASPSADPILAQSVAGSPTAVDYPAPGFSLTSLRGRAVPERALRGKAALIAFLDPDCQVSCPPVGRELRQALVLVGGLRPDVVVVGILGEARPGTAALERLSRGMRLGPGRSWTLLTGTPAQIHSVWRAYGVSRAWSRHGDVIFVVDPSGYVRHRYQTGAGPGTPATDSSFGVLFANAIRQALSA